MSTDQQSGPRVRPTEPTDDHGSSRTRAGDRDAQASPPTTPCTVVWSRGRPYVLESGSGRPRWMGTDHHGRPQSLTGDELRRRGWTYRRSC
ncbi:hypothetical protein B1813_04600 [Saccharomonospora piscinae]|uniref:Uncharacterized protein n=1 Tax=Saccharomonospora piscinae TaxID=687388 RepID=A0A1V9A9P5_SACPI|nr:hypothetical protein [Saccharomonospora piscinae]OQO93813.1 hypothetical protein B1813_04600 [Saccharomonospora piscinae]